MSGYQLDPTQPQFSDALTRYIQQTIADMLADPTSLPASFKSWLPQYLETNPPILPLSQMIGYQRQTQSSRVSNSSAQTVPTGATRTVLTFDTKVFDYGGMWVSTANTKLTVQLKGKYLVGAHVNWAGVAGDKFVAIRTNGTTEIAAQVTPAPAAFAPDQSVSSLLDLSVGDYIETVVLQNSGVNATVNTVRTFQWAVRVGA